MPETGAPVRLRVLLVDDNATDRLLALRALQREGPPIEAVQPTDAASLATALSQGGFDLVVTDYSLRWSDGLAVTRAIKARSPLCPVVMYTGTGIGLAIVRRGAERMGGDAGVESSPDRGSRFWIEVPMENRA